MLTYCKELKTIRSKEGVPYQSHLNRDAPDGRGRGQVWRRDRGERAEGEDAAPAASAVSREGRAASKVRDGKQNVWVGGGGVGGGGGTVRDRDSPTELIP